MKSFSACLGFIDEINQLKVARLHTLICNVKNKHSQLEAEPKSLQKLPKIEHKSDLKQILKQTLNAFKIMPFLQFTKLFMS